jgi:hypothetical protein
VLGDDLRDPAPAGPQEVELQVYVIAAPQFEAQGVELAERPLPTEEANRVYVVPPRRPIGPHVGDSDAVDDEPSAGLEGHPPVDGRHGSKSEQQQDRHQSIVRRNLTIAADPCRREKPRSRHAGEETVRPDTHGIVLDTHRSSIGTHEQGVSFTASTVSRSRDRVVAGVLDLAQRDSDSTGLLALLAGVCRSMDRV